MLVSVGLATKLDEVLDEVVVVAGVLDGIAAGVDEAEP